MFYVLLAIVGGIYLISESNKGEKEIGWKGNDNSNSNNANNPYIDMGVWPNVIYNSGCLSWSDPVGYNYNCLQTFLLPFWTNLKSGGANSMFLAFAQVNNLNYLVNRQFAPNPQGDTIDMLYDPNNLGKPVLPNTGAPSSLQNMDLLGALIQLGLDQGITARLSFGGEAASPLGWTLPSSPSATTIAQNLINYCNSYNIRGLDFDVESDYLFDYNSASNLANFFGTLQTQTNIVLTLAVEGSWNTNLDFINYFNYVNLMLYEGAGGHQAVTPQWLDTWMLYPQISKNPQKLAVGFNADINYNNPSQSCDTDWCPSIPQGTANGAAAAMTFQQAAAAMTSTTPPPSSLQFAENFWWLDDPTSLMNSASPQVVFSQNFWQQF